MAYKDHDRQRQFQREFMARRRQEFFHDKACADCGSKSKLQLDHDERDKKVSHRIWSWRKERREIELSKCTVRCQTCHIKRHVKEGIWKVPHRLYRKISFAQAQEVRRLAQLGHTNRQLAKDFGLSATSVHHIKHFRRYLSA